MDGFTVVAIGGLALLELAPNALTDGGLLAALFLAAGFALPMWLHKLGDLGQFSDRILVIFLTLHTMVESAALATADAHSVEALGLAIVAHQLPVGLAAYSLAPRSRAGWLSVLVIGLGMVVGFFAGEAAAMAMSVQQSAWLQAMAAGSLLHVLSGHEEPRESSTHEAMHHGHGHSHAHRHSHAHGHSPPSPVPGPAYAHGHAHGSPGPDGEYERAPSSEGPSRVPSSSTVATLLRSLSSSPRRARAGFVGGIFGLLLVVATFVGEHGPEHHEGEFFGAVVDLALESAPALLLGYLCAALVVWALSARRVSALSSPNPLTQAARGVAYGLPLPICSCSSFARSRRVPICRVARSKKAPVLRLIMRPIPISASKMSAATCIARPEAWNACW